jgi:Holliday junction resolvase-like predicted endonuclease
LKTVFTEKQRRVSALGKRGEKKAKEWLEERGFTVEEWFPRAHAGHYDIKARKGREKWIIEVKTGENPSINVDNFLRMIDEKGYNRIGLAIVTEDDVHLLQIKKTKIAVLKAWKTRRKDKK